MTFIYGAILGGEMAIDEYHKFIDEAPIEDIINNLPLKYLNFLPSIDSVKGIKMGNLLSEDSKLIATAIRKLLKGE